MELLFGWSKFSFATRPIRTATQIWHVSRQQFLGSFLNRHFAGKPLVTSPDVGCFLASCNCKPGFVLNIIPSFLDCLRLEAVLHKSVILIQMGQRDQCTIFELPWASQLFVPFLPDHVCDGRVTLVAGQLFSIL